MQQQRDEHLTTGLVWGGRTTAAGAKTVERVASLLFLGLISLMPAHSSGASTSARSTNSVPTHAYRIIGEVSYKGSEGDANIPFSIEVGGCNRWIIHLTNGISDYDAIGCDGKDTYRLSCIRSAVESTMRSMGTQTPPGLNWKTNVPNIATANVFRGLVPRFPFGADHCAGSIWLTYASASGCYFRNNVTNGWAEPAACVNVPSPRGYTHLFPEDYVLKRVIVGFGNSDLHGGPQTVDYLEGGTNPYDQKPYPPPLDAGFTNTAFEITDTTNWHELTFPLTARMTTFGLDYASAHRGEGKLRVYHEYEIHTKAITEVPPRGDYRPTVPGVTSICDDRFTPRIGSGVSIKTTNWLTASEVMSSRQFKRAAMATGKWQIKTPPILLLPFLFVLFLPAIYYWARRGQKAKSTGSGSQLS